MACSMSSTKYMAQFVSSSSEKNDGDSFQRSSWSSYVQDFIANNYGMEEDSSFMFDFGSEGSSMAFDNARKTDVTSADQDLEDTATSPAQSPKVNDFGNLLMMSNKIDKNDFCEEKGQISLQKTEDIQKGLLETELRRKGLCLVPVSMLVNYVGCNI